MIRKYNYSLFVLILFIFINFSCAQYFDQPESIVYDDLNDCYFISNNGSGRIARLSSTDTTFTGFEGNLGLLIIDTTLFALKSPSIIMGYQLSTNDTIFELEISGAGLLNDITVDTSGFLYLTDFNEHKIYKVNRNTRHYSVFVSSGITSPNGILYDRENNRLIFCESFSNQIKAVNLVDSTVTTIVTNGPSSMDGLAWDKMGNIYVSSWQTSAVYRYDPSFSNERLLVSSGHNGPADIFINQDADLLCVPNYNNNTISFIPLQYTPIDNERDALPFQLNLLQNYPNPFNPVTTMGYTIPYKTKVAIAVYNALGQKIATIVDGFKDKGEYRLSWNASGFTSGVYFFRMQADGQVFTRRAVLIK